MRIESRRILEVHGIDVNGASCSFCLSEAEARQMLLDLAGALNEPLGQLKSVMDKPKLVLLKVVFDRLLTRADDNNIQGAIDNLRDIRQFTGAGLKEAKDFQEYCIWRFRDNYDDNSRFCRVAKMMEPHNFPSKLLDLYYALVCLNDVKVDESTMMEHLDKLL